MSAQVPHRLVTPPQQLQGWAGLSDSEIFREDKTETHVYLGSEAAI